MEVTLQKIRHHEVADSMNVELCRTMEIEYGWLVRV